MNIAEFSPCRLYRYTLWRDVDMFNIGTLMCIGLNPSTADEVNNDPTVRRCIGFAQRLGYGKFCMTNIFAYRATYPKDMKAQSDPVGIDNDKWLLEIASSADIIIAAWGVHGTHNERSEHVKKLLSDFDIYCLGKTKDGHPKHPLYVPYDVKIELL